ncbi:MAG: hypothetical protein HY034_05545 [Nitrospirae bacterium]|nr:hypothetical protein [Nitrospirota bacterium]
MNYSELVEKGIAEERSPNLKEVRSLQDRGMEELTIAKNILNSDRGWAYAISFYAMLRTAKVLILAEGLMPKERDETKNIIIIAGAILGKDFKSLLNKLDRMRRRTENFVKDYNKPITKYESQQALTDAEGFINRMNDIIRERHSQLLLNISASSQ